MARAPHQRGGGPDLPEITITEVNLREALGKAKEISPKIATNLRRSLRAVGDDIIQEQRDILSGKLPGNARKTGKAIRRIKRKNGGSYLRTVNVYKAQSAKRSRSTGMRNKIKNSLKTRIVAGATRSGISIKADKGVGGVMVKGWNKKILRHPVFGSKDTYVSQFGQPYWWEPIKRGQLQARQKALAAIDDALKGKG